MLIIKQFNELTLEELYTILKWRCDIFVVEQQCPYGDLDGLDQDATHLWIMEDSFKAYLRLFYKDETTIQLGRVLSTSRGTGYGRAIVEAGINYAKTLKQVTSIYIEAQCYAIGFYEKMGLKVVSEPFDEDGIPHVKMILHLSEDKDD